MQTNDRRKVFETPLDALRWMLGSPGRRVATDRRGYRHYVKVLEDGYVGRYRTLSNGESEEVMPLLTDCPLTAVGDEHGVIPEPEKNDPLVRAFKMAFSPALSDYDRASMAKAIRDEIDERISAAKLEAHIQGEQWALITRYRLKPGGE